MKSGRLTIATSAATLISLACIAQSYGQDGPPPGGDRPALCGIECIPVAVKAAAECHDGGGNFLECAKAFADALNACRAAAGCDTPTRPPICGEECLTAAREAATACKDAGGDVAACLADVKAKLKECLTAAGCDLPSPPDGPPRCGLTCLKDAVTAARECLKGGGTFRDCASAFIGSIKACRESADCSEGDDPPPDQEEEVLGLVLEEPFIRGDANGDGLVDISDPIAILGFVFLGSAAPVCADAADATDNGVLDISDPILILSSLFRDSGPLPPPYPSAGFDPTEDSVVCGRP